MKAIVLAAGYAKRLYPLTENMPKALLEVDGKPVLDYILDKIDELDAIDEVIIISNHKFIDFFVEWKSKNKYKKNITLLDDGSTCEENKLGAVGDINFAIKHFQLNEDIIVIAGDNLFTYSLKDFYNYFKQVDKDCIVASKIDNPEELKRMGVALLDKNGKIVDLEEKPIHPKSDIAAFAGYIYVKETLPLFEEYMQKGNNPDAPGYFSEWLYKKKELYAFLFKGNCYDIGTTESYKLVNNIFSSDSKK